MIRRLSHRDDFRALRRDGRTVRRGPLEVRFRPADAAAQGSGPGGIRVAYAIGRTVGGAVVRNRIRRQLRAVMSEVEAMDPRPRDGDYLIRVMPQAAGMGFAQLRSDALDAVSELAGGGSG